MGQVTEKYKQTEIGFIPVDWNIEKVGNICGFIVPGRNKPKIFNGDIPWITTPDIEGNIVSVSKQNLCITKEEAKNVGSKIVLKNSVIISCVGELGIATIAGRDIVINQQLHAFLPNDKINNYYLLYALKRQKYFMESVATITAVPYMNKNNCNSIPVPLPPTKTEQTAIATVLSDADSYIDCLEKLIAKKRDIKQGVMQQLLQPKDDWVVKKLGGICARITTGKLDANAMDDNGDYLFFTCSKTIYRTNTYSFQGESLLIAGNGEVGEIKYYDGKFDAYQRTYVLQEFACFGKFLYYFLRQYLPDRINEETNHGAMPFIKLGTLTGMIISIPKEKSEQNRIATILSDIDADITTLEKQLAKAQSIKEGMMQQLLTGKIRLI